MKSLTAHALTALLAIAFSVPISLIASETLTNNTPPMVTFDLKGAVKKYSGSLAYYLPQIGITELSDALLDEKAREYALVLEAELEAYADTHNVVILVQSAVVNGAIDITPIIEQQAMARVNAKAVP